MAAALTLLKPKMLWICRDVNALLSVEAARNVLFREIHHFFCTSECIDQHSELLAPQKATVYIN